MVIVERAGFGDLFDELLYLDSATPGTVGSLVTDLLEGNEEIIHYPAGYNAGYPLPYKKCPECHGTVLSNFLYVKIGLTSRHIIISLI